MMVMVMTVVTSMAQHRHQAKRELCQTGLNPPELLELLYEYDVACAKSSRLIMIETKDDACVFKIVMFLVSCCACVGCCSP
eukprot:m.251817 g.251817  ORF g.251817 m.251817 type:complete len:81 (-) comp19114_c0_seq8:189-431(-)